VLLVALLGAPALGGGQRVRGCHGAEKILARVGDGFLTEADLCQVIARQLAALELQKYRLRKTTLERRIGRRLLEYYPDPPVTLNCPSWRYCTAVPSEPMFPNLGEDDWGLLWDPSNPEQNRLVNASIAWELVGGSFRYDDCETACRYASDNPCCVFYCN
jgi:hypothetical protein